MKEEEAKCGDTEWAMVDAVGYKNEKSAHDTGKYCVLFSILLQR